MKNLFSSVFILIFFFPIFDYTLNPEISPGVSIEAPYNESKSSNIILHREKYALMLSSKSFDTGNIRKVLLLLGFDSREVVFSLASYQQIRHSIDSVSLICGIPSFILIIGDEDAIPPYRERFNPYTNNQYSTDFDYGLLCEDLRLRTLVSRIPAKNQASLDIYTENLLKYLLSNESSKSEILAPFYDFDKDSVEDYLYYTFSYKISNSITDCRLLSETDSPCPKYLYDGSEIDDSMQYPFNDWLVDIGEINSDSPLLLCYRGHGNPISMVLPEIPLSEISSINLKMSGSLFSFTCLLSSFDNETSGFSNCFSESIIFLNTGFAASVGFSSETFYQYNNLFLNILFDHLNDNIYKTLSSSFNPSISKSLFDCCNALLTIYGVNDYTLCQISSMQIFGIPSLSLIKQNSSKPFCVNNTLDISDSSICVTLFLDAPFYLSTDSCLYDSVPSEAGTYFIKIENLSIEDRLFASSYFNGILFIDTIEVTGSGFSVADAGLSDDTGDNDGLIESGERVSFSFKTLPYALDSCIVKCSYPILQETLKQNEDGIFLIEFTLPKDAEEVHLEIIYEGISSFWSFPVNRYTVILNKMQSMDSPFIFPNETHQMMFEFYHNRNFSTPCTLSFISSDDYIFTSLKPMVLFETDSAVFFNEMSVLSDSFCIEVEYKCNLFADTFTIPFVCAKRNSLFIYDPKNQYLNSEFTSFLRDSLKCALTINRELNDTTFYPANIFAFGIYPNNKSLDSGEAYYIKKCASYGSSMLLDGGDALGFDKEGKNLISLFNISSAEDGSTVYAGSEISFLPFGLTMIADTTVKFVDNYTADSPYLFLSQRIIGCNSEDRMVQSYPLTKIASNDNHWLYYLYASILLNYSHEIEFAPSINLTFKKSAIVKNHSKNPVMIKILSIPSFFDSIKFMDSRIIPPDSQNELIFFIKRDSPSFTAEIDFTSGFDTMNLSLVYSPNSKPKMITAHIKADSFSFKIEEEGALLLPQKAQKTCFVKRSGNTYTLFGDIKMLEEEEIIFRTASQDYIILLPKLSREKRKEEECAVYNILGEKTKVKPNGLYFSEERKFIHIK